MEKNCTTCKWDFRGNFTSELFFPCLQGHMRMINLGQVVSIEDCHAWKEKEKCECWNIKLEKVTCKKCGRVIE